MTFYIFLLIIVICIVMSLRLLFLPYKIKGKKVSFENFLMLGMLYATIMIGFGLIYMLLEMKGVVLVTEETSRVGGDFFTRLEKFIYFSGVTLFSVGYGDISPIGPGRLIAIIEALIGYTIPAAFVAKAVFDHD